MVGRNRPLDQIHLILRELTPNSTRTMGTCISLAKCRVLFESEHSSLYAARNPRARGKIMPLASHLRVAIPGTVPGSR